MKIFLVLIGLVTITSILTSCIKERNTGAVDFTQLTPIVQIVEGGFTAGNFKAQTLGFDPADPSDTISFRLNYAATNVAPKDIVVTLSVDPTALAIVNNYSAAIKPAPGPVYKLMPDSIFKFTQTKVTIKAGQSYSDLVNFIVFPNKVDPTISYVLPITIKDASGVNISGNFGSIYYHIIGNPLAGSYKLIGTRYAYTGSIGWSGLPAPYPPYVATLDLGGPFSPKVASAVNGQTISIDFSNLGSSGYSYLITGDATFATATVAYNAAVLGGDVIKFSAITGYSFIGAGTVANPKPTFRIITHYNNAATGAGNDRILDELFTHL